MTQLWKQLKRWNLPLVTRIGLAMPLLLVLAALLLLVRSSDLAARCHLVAWSAMEVARAAAVGQHGPSGVGKPGACANTAAVLAGCAARP